MKPLQSCGATDAPAGWNTRKAVNLLTAEETDPRTVRSVVAPEAELPPGELSARATTARAAWADLFNVADRVGNRADLEAAIRKRYPGVSLTLDGAVTKGTPAAPVQQGAGRTQGRAGSLFLAALALLADVRGALAGQPAWVLGGAVGAGAALLIFDERAAARRRRLVPGGVVGDRRRADGGFP